MTTLTLEQVTQSQNESALASSLWYAVNLPGLARHTILAGRYAHEPLLAEFFSLAERGDVGKLQADPALAELYSLAAAYEPAPALQRMAKERAASLPADFFAKATAELNKPPTMIIHIDPGAGEWPKKPKHTCNEGKATGSVVTIRGNETAVSRLVTPAWRDSEEAAGCQACQYDRAYRFAQQIIIEHYHNDGAIWSLWLDSEAELRRFAKRAKYRVAGYVAFPTSGGRYLVVHTNGHEKSPGEPVTNERADVFRLISAAANDTPEDKRVSCSAGWGGRWQGARGDGRAKQAKRSGEEVEPALQVWSYTSHFSLAGHFGEVKGGADSFTYQIDARAAFNILATAGVALYVKKTNEQSLADFLAHHGCDVVMGEGGKLTLIHSEDAIPGDGDESGAAADVASSGAANDAFSAYNAHKAEKHMCVIRRKIANERGNRPKANDGGGAK
jgi:hypothetical protein